MSLRSKLCKELRNYAQLRTKPCGSLPIAGRLRTSRSDHNFGGHGWSSRSREVFHWVSLTGPAAIILGTCLTPSLAEDVSNESNSKSGTESTYYSSFQKIEDGSVISNEHTSKWRIFTDNGRDYFLNGNIEQAEKFFQSALQEAREGFGDTDPHVASSCNNLAELFRVKKDYDKAEPLYLEAIDILENYFGTEDVRVGAALHNLGQFYLVQRKLEKARLCYERAVKIKRRVLGEAHPEYADAMYHLGSVLYLQGEEKDAVDLIADSIRVLEAGGQGESVVCVRRTQYLAQMYTKSNRFAEAEALLRKILHMMELLRGWKSLDTVLVAERLALVLEKASRLMEAEELLERCLDARRNLLPDEHIQNAANMLYIARVKVRISKQLLKTKGSQVTAELDMAKHLLLNSIRVARLCLEQKVKEKPSGVHRGNEKDAQSAILILLQSLNALGTLEIMIQELMGSGGHVPKAEAALSQCVSTFKEFGSEYSISDTPQVKAEYLLCLKHLDYLISNGKSSKVENAKEIRGEIQRVETELAKIEQRRS
ncbi:Tetratricopeptide repeat (TPR)-like superfamily protein [Striga hermonthica]|uniref:Tetratricopeptide repeat (TPR)-like superfamily protein n=1 Tax=Striga hermonthica TaxID=68872 RepID=A0A9N7RMB5_STRHE|nr:Tetratricopeptide repeat (TPR)-like superfamily protein [Striga hermonthica]